MTLSLMTRHRRYGKCKCGGGFPLPSSMNNWTQTAYPRSHMQIDQCFVHTCLSSTRVYIYVTCHNSYAVQRIMIALMSLPWKNPWVRQCDLLCCSQPLYNSTPTAQCRVTQGRARAQ